MAKPVQHKPVELPAFEFIAKLSSAYIKGAGQLLYCGSCYIVDKISLTKYGDSLEKARTEWKGIEETAMKVLFIVGSIYNCYTNFPLFLAGALLGFAATLPIPLVGIEFLSEYKTAGWDKDSGYRTQKVMTMIFACNKIDLFNPLIDNFVNSGLGGFVFGFWVNRVIADTYKEKYPEICESAKTLVNSFITFARLQELVPLAEVRKTSSAQTPTSSDPTQGKK